MKVAVLDDCQDAFRRLDCSNRLEGHDVIVIHDAARDEAQAAAGWLEPAWRSDRLQPSIGPTAIPAILPSRTGSN